MKIMVGLIRRGRLAEEVMKVMEIEEHTHRCSGESTMQKQHVYDWHLTDQGGHIMLKCQRIRSLPERLREVFVMFSGGVTIPGTEFSDSI